MKNDAVSLCVALLLSVPLIATSAENSYKDPYPHPARLLEAEQAKAQTLGLLGREAVDEHNWDQTFLDVVIKPGLRDFTFTGQATLTGTVRSANLTAIDLNLGTADTLDSVSINGVNRSWGRARDAILGDQSRINVDISGMNLGVDDTFTMIVYYHGPMNQGNMGLIYDYSTMRGDYRSGVLYSMAEPYDGRKWIACYDLPGDKLDSSRVTVVFRPDYRVLSNGYLMSDSVFFDGQDSLRATTWFNPDPISTYLISIAACNYLVHDAGTAGVNNTPMSFWVYPVWYYDDIFNPSTYTAEKAIYDFGRTGSAIEMMEHFFLPYPFNKYDQVMVPMGGAMEHQTATSMSQRLVGDGTRAGESVVVHELAHQWWGDYVGPQTFKDIWLNEGFASYAEALWSEYNYPPAISNSIMPFQENAKSYDYYYAFPIYDPPSSQLFSTTVYDKGASILHMLRWTVGDSAFFTGMRNYGLDHAYGVATTDEFKAEMESASRMDLTTFFNEWVYGMGYPTYNLHSWWLTEKVNGTWDMYIDLSQDQRTSWPLFAIDLPISVRQGYSRELDTTYTVPMHAVRRDTVVLADIPFEPTRVFVNRDRWVMCEVTGEKLDVEDPKDAALPGHYEVSPAWPNPFNAGTEFNVNVTHSGVVDVRIFNLLGQQVANLNSNAMSAGVHRFTWRPDLNRASGTYLVRVQTCEGVITRRITLIR